MKKLDQLNKAIYGLEQTHPQYSMRLFLAKIAKLLRYDLLKYSLLSSVILLVASLIWIFPKTIFFSLSILYLSVQLFKLYLVVNGVIMLENSAKQLILPKELPIYTILLPLYKEAEILPQLITAISNLDYPAHLLDVKLLIEMDDQETLRAAISAKLPEYIEIINVPSAHPRTKAKACNYGLQFARGKYVVIYDAEDIPKSSQLKQVVAMFSASAEDIVCIQAKLNFYNYNENMLTKLFTLEYGLLFNYLLPALQKLNLPIALGGTSNHFIREKLIELGAWDAFNVTEDADLGMRLYQLGFRAKIIDSITLEEAPVSYPAWIKQRTRWIKGHLLTSIMHLINSNNLSLKAKISILLTLFLPNLAYLFLPIYMLLSLFIDDYICNFFYQLDIGLGMILPIAYTYLVTLKQRLLKALDISNITNIIFASPIYYFLLSIAAINAVIEIFKKPFHWNKTKHGISKFQ